MKREAWFMLSAAISLLAAGCQPAPSVSSTNSTAVAEATEAAPTAGDPQQRALVARDALFKQLSTRLVEAMSSGGPAAAIEVCSQEARKIAKSVGERHGVAIGRTSFKLRNPRNSAPDWAQPLIERRQAEPAFVTLPAGETGALLPIKLKPQCLTCHGPTAQIADNVTAALAKLYPDDQATGFQEGDLRGWFWVVVRAPDASAVSNAHTDGAHTDGLPTDGAPARALPSGAEAFARFDEVYIPALALTKQEKTGPGKAALRKLTARWQQLRPHLAQAIAADEQWPQDLEGIDAAIRAAVGLAQEDQLAEAHEALEVIRDLMMEARRRQGISYALDSLSDFHTTMEEIVKPAMELTPEKLNAGGLARLEALCRVADEKWKVAESAQFELPLFGLEASAAEPLGALIQGERRAISKLQSALANGEKQAVIQAARGLKPPFAKTYMFFGDFPQPASPPPTDR